MLAGFTSAENNADLSFIIYRKNPFWSLVRVSEFGHGSIFIECEDLIRSSLRFAGFVHEVPEEAEE